MKAGTERRWHGAIAKPGRRLRKPKRPETYHHGSLREALLQAAERILERDGIQGLTLRAAAREAGVSHAAPKNHFGDLSGLLSELAAVGFERFVAMMQANVRDGDPPAPRMAAIGRGYVTFARAHPGLFVLMFRSERLDMSRPALRAAVDASGARAVGRDRREPRGEGGGDAHAASGRRHRRRLVAGARLCHAAARRPPEAAAVARLPPGTDADALLGAIFMRARRKG